MLSNIAAEAREACGPFIVYATLCALYLHKTQPGATAGDYATEPFRLGFEIGRGLITAVVQAL